MKVVVALALGLGTMIGWKRIVVTVGEKIGKEHLTYGQGAAAEIIAMATIGAADGLGLPVSTTHVLSSGVAGTMLANGSGIQLATLRNIALAWVLTLPVGDAAFGRAVFHLPSDRLIADNGLLNSRRRAAGAARPGGFDRAAARSRSGMARRANDGQPGRQAMKSPLRATMENSCCRRPRR